MTWSLLAFEPGGAGERETNNPCLAEGSRQTAQSARLFTLCSESQERQLGQRQCHVTLPTPHWSQRKRALGGAGSSAGCCALRRASSSGPAFPTADNASWPKASRSVREPPSASLYRSSTLSASPAATATRAASICTRAAVGACTRAAASCTRACAMSLAASAASPSSQQ